jgi:hypothetical protein
MTVDLNEEPAPRKLKRRKVSNRTTRWSPKLANTIKIVLLDSNLEYVVKDTLACDLKAAPHDVGQALASLCREGILSGPIQHPIEYTDEYGKKHSESVRVKSERVTWNGKSWVRDISHLHKRVFEFGLRYYNPYTKPGYRNSRPSKRELSKIEKKYPRTEDSGWDGIVYKIERDSVAFKKLQKVQDPLITCKRCGNAIPPGFRKHDKNICNTLIISEVMET